MVSIDNNARTNDYLLDEIALLWKWWYEHIDHGTCTVVHSTEFVGTIKKRLYLNSF